MKWADQIKLAHRLAKSEEEKLFAQWLPLVVRECKRLGRNDDDSFQIGAIGLMKAVREWWAERGHIANIAARCILNALGNDWIYSRRGKRDPGREQTNEFGGVGTSQNWEASDAQMEYRAFLSHATEREREVIEFYLLEGNLAAQKRFGITKTRVNALVREGVKRIRRAVGA